MAISISESGELWNSDKDKGTGIFAKQTKGGRWQYRMDSHRGSLIASGVTPASFVKRFWMRDDFEG